MGNRCSAIPSMTSEISIEEDEPPDEEGLSRLSLILLDTRNLSLASLDAKNGKIHTLIRVQATFDAKIHTKPVKYCLKNETDEWLLPDTKFVFSVSSRPVGEVTVSLLQNNLPPLPAIPLGPPSPSPNEKKSEKAVCIGRLKVPISEEDIQSPHRIQRWIKVERCTDEISEPGEVLVSLKYSPTKSRVLQAGESITDKYEVDNVLGAGQSVVKKAKNKENKKDYAIKFLNKHFKGQTVPKQTLTHEVDMLKTISHENIVSLCEAVESQNTLYMVMELVEGVDLLSVSQSLGPLRPALAGYVIGRIVSAVSYLHARGIVHMDVKPENVLVNYLNNSVKLTDFGSAKEVAKMTGVAGTINYMAPEIIKRMNGLNQHCDQSVDIWSIGVVAYVLLSGANPFEAKKTNDNIINRILAGKFDFSGAQWDAVPKQCKDFVVKCLQLDPKKRPTAMELMKHPWISSSPVSCAFTRREQDLLEEHKTSRNNSRSNSLTSIMELFGAVPSRS